MDKLERMLERAAQRRRRRPRRRRRGLLDGGRHRALPAIVELCERYGARLMVDEAHGVGVLGERGAGRLRALRARGPRRPADGHLLEEPRLLRRLHRRARRRHRVPARSRLAPSCSPPPRCPPRSAPRSRPCGSAAARAGRCSSDCSTTPPTCTAGLTELGLQGRRADPAAGRQRGADADRPGRRRRGLAGGDCYGRRSSTPASTPTSRCTPPCRRAGRCCGRA